eukprot:1160955-Pelagomonas_calceolata.AAC.5
MEGLGGRAAPTYHNFLCMLTKLAPQGILLRALMVIVPATLWRSPGRGHNGLVDLLKRFIGEDIKGMLQGRLRGGSRVCRTGPFDSDVLSVLGGGQLAGADSCACFFFLWVLGTNTCRNLSCLHVVNLVKAGENVSPATD